MPITSPGPEVQRRSISIRFDVDCGELVSGHHFIARGVSFVDLVSPEELARIERLDKPRPGEGRPDQSYFRNLVAPEGGFLEGDESDDARLWRGWQRLKAQIAAAPKTRGCACTMNSRQVFPPTLVRMRTMKMTGFGTSSASSFIPTFRSRAMMLMRA